MSVHRESFTVETPGRGTTEISSQVQAIVAQAGIREGLCTVFVHHTSASLTINENADPDVQVDLDAFLNRLVRDGDPLFVHRAEGPDDMPAHVRTALTQTSLSIPVAGGRCDLGTWQGIFLWEHRQRPHQRRITVCITGDTLPPANRSKVQGPSDKDRSTFCRKALRSLPEERNSFGCLRWGSGSP